MPLFAALMASIGNALASFFARFLGIRAALVLASYALFITITGAFIASVYVCVGGLLTYITGWSGGGASSGNWLGYFLVGLGMFIPANAGGVMACIGSVWLGCNIYTLQRLGTISFSR